MKSFWILLNTVFFLSLSFEAVAQSRFEAPSTAALFERAPAQTYTCKYISGDVGTIVGRGSSKNAAFADAAEQCFERRVKAYEQNRQTKVDMDRGQDFIDSCVNIQCS